jgi:hypothetical protein
MEIDFEQLFSQGVLARLFPRERANQFFEAVYGGAEEGAFDITLVFREFLPDTSELQFELQLEERPGKCLACNLTYGLPEVFAVHPVIDLKGLVKKIQELIGDPVKCAIWTVHPTQTLSDHLHRIPLTITLEF